MNSILKEEPDKVSEPRRKEENMFKEIDGKTYFLLDISDPDGLNILLRYYEEIKLTNPDLAKMINDRLNNDFLQAVSN